MMMDTMPELILMKQKSSSVILKTSLHIALQNMKTGLTYGE